MVLNQRNQGCSNLDQSVEIDLWNHADIAQSLGNYFQWHKDCWHKKKKTKESKHELSSVIMHFNAKAFDTFAKFPVQVNVFKTLVIMDSGSTVNIVNSDFVHLAAVTVEYKDTLVTMAGGQCARIVGVARFPLQITEHTRTVEDLVMPHFSYFMLLGINVGRLFPIGC